MNPQRRLRLIGRLDIKNEFLIKGIQMEGVRKLGDPVLHARRYYEQGIDELLFLDAVASLYGRNNVFQIAEAVCRDVFVPITIGGGLRSLADIDAALGAGADRVAVCTEALKTPDFISEAARVFGSQCIVGSIQAKRRESHWEAYSDCGREASGIDVVRWAQELEALGAGELLLTSVDRDGTRQGYDVALMAAVSAAVGIPVQACGGAGGASHVREVFDGSEVEAAVVGTVLHYGVLDVGQLKGALASQGVPIRRGGASAR